MTPRESAAPVLPPTEENPLVRFLETMTAEERAILDRAAELDREHGSDVEAEQVARRER